MLTSLHVQRYARWQSDFVRDVGVGYVKIVNPQAGMAFPDTTHILGRIWTDNIDVDYLRRGREGGAAFVRDMLPRWRAVPEVDIWELGNEPDCNSNEGLALLNAYSLGAMEEAEKYGICTCILNLAEGNPHDNGTGNEGSVRWKWNELRPCITAAIRYGHYLGRHCYWRPDVEGPTGRWHALGRLQEDIAMLKDLGIDVDSLKVLVNETGIDGGIAGHTPQQGWRILTDAATYRAQIVEAERYAREYLPQVRGMMLFTSGYEGPWGSFEHDVEFCGSLIGPLTALDGAPAIPEIPPPDTTKLLAPLRREDVVRITQRFTPPSHYGIDYSCYEGTPVFASCDGIAYRGNQPGGFGLYIRVEDGAGLYVYAAHLRAWAVADGALVQVGDLIGYSGNTGNSTGPHLHYEVRRAAPGAPRPTSAQGAIDPEPMLYWPEDAVPEPIPEPEPVVWLPSTDPFTIEAIQSGDVAQVWPKRRWWNEQAVRDLEAGKPERALEILRDMATPGTGLDYVIEEMLT